MEVRTMRHFDSQRAFKRVVWARSPRPGEPKQLWTYVVEDDPTLKYQLAKALQFGDRYSESPAALRYGG